MKNDDYKERGSDYDDQPFVIEGAQATALFYFAIWLAVCGLWKTIEVLAFFAKFLPRL